MPIETEIRVQLTNVDYLRLIRDIDWDNIDDIVDITFGLDGIYSMEKNGWIVRIRQKGSMATLEYKSRVKDLNSTWHEIAVEIDSTEKMAMILKNIGLKCGLLIKKHRRTKTSGNIIVSLDYVEGLGYFIEAELVGEDVDEARVNLLNEKLLSLGLKNINLADAYGDLLINKIKDNQEFKEWYESKMREYFLKIKIQT